MIAFLFSWQMSRVLISQFCEVCGDVLSERFLSDELHVSIISKTHVIQIIKQQANNETEKWNVAICVTKLQNLNWNQLSQFYLA